MLYSSPLFSVNFLFPAVNSFRKPLPASLEPRQARTLGRRSLDLYDGFIRRVSAEMAAIQRDLPTGMKARVAYDATDYITNAIHEVLSTLGDRSKAPRKPGVNRLGPGGARWLKVRVTDMVTGKAKDTGRWGPTWYYNDQLCSVASSDCVNHNTEQFLAIAKDAGRFTACAQDTYPVAAGGTSCGWIDVQ